MTGHANRLKHASPPAGSRPGLPVVVLLVAALAAVVGCSVEKNYRLLSFFFDGVEAPAGQDGAAEGARGPAGAASTVALSAHTAYTQRRCADCHGGRAQMSGFLASGFSDIDDSICLQCHDTVIDEHAYVHGPVAAVACLQCHEPHDSRYPHLLVIESPQLCLRCHQFQLQGAPQVAEHEDPGRDCLECHAAHGGADRYFMRPAPPPEPADDEGGP